MELNNDDIERQSELPWWVQSLRAPSTPSYSSSEYSVGSEFARNFPLPSAADENDSRRSQLSTVADQAFAREKLEAGLVHLPSNAEIEESHERSTIPAYTTKFDIRDPSDMEARNKLRAEIMAKKRSEIEAGFTPEQRAYVKQRTEQLAVSMVQKNNLTTNSDASSTNAENIPKQSGIAFKPSDLSLRPHSHFDDSWTNNSIPAQRAAAAAAQNQLKAMRNPNTMAPNAQGASVVKKNNADRLPVSTGLMGPPVNSRSIENLGYNPVAQPLSILDTYNGGSLKPAFAYYTKMPRDGLFGCLWQEEFDNELHKHLNARLATGEGIVGSLVEAIREAEIKVLIDEAFHREIYYEDFTPRLETILSYLHFRRQSAPMISSSLRLQRMMGMDTRSADKLHGITVRANEAGVRLEAAIKNYKNDPAELRAALLQAGTLYAQALTVEGEPRSFLPGEMPWGDLGGWAHEKKGKENEKEQDEEDNTDSEVGSEKSGIRIELTEVEDTEDVEMDLPGGWVGVPQNAPGH